MKADNWSGFYYDRSENTSSKVLGMHRKVDTKTLNKLFSDSWPTDYPARTDVTIKKLQHPKRDLNSAVVLLSSLRDYFAFNIYEKQGEELSGSALDRNSFSRLAVSERAMR